MATISRLSVSLTANTKRFRKGMLSAKKTLSGFVGSIFSAKTAIVGLVGAAGIGLAVRNLIQVNARVQTLKTSLKTMTGSAKEANKAFKDIEQFAKTTPFDLEQVVSGFIKLKSLGLDPSMKALRSYGNTASAMGKDLNEFIEAVADASTNEFERLKEFGIKAKQQGDKVSFTFQGVSKTVAKTSKEITDYLQNIGNTTFSTAMDDQADTLKTTISNLGGALVKLKSKIGEAGINDLVAEIAKTMTAWIDGITTDSVQAFTDAVVKMGFWVARSFVSMIVWIGEFVSRADSLTSLWIRMKLGLSKLTQFALKSFHDIATGFFQLTLILWKNLNGKVGRFLGIDEDFLADGIKNALEFRGLIQGLEADQIKTTSGLVGELATQKRIDESTRFDDTFRGGLKAFEVGAEELFKKLEMKYAGEEMKQFGPGESYGSPYLKQMTETLEQQLRVMQSNSTLAVAG
jgi:hypothetical protein